ncbi:spore coat protein U domain-containing protein [Rhodanobacter sp. T12-5]|uniref:Csu type fimbrial protein n=1 Tax=Rhodanobacter sp. T12-5 TaxID=2024611 RepID=UPI001561B4CB|nr:spore coat protein U domain-containing protein [Rhodanobacter sp. T12-5]
MHSNTRFTRSAMVAAMIVAFAALGGTATAATTDTMTVSANVVASCSIAVTGALDFGAYDPQSATDATGTGTVATTCTAGTPSVKIALDQGLNPTGTSTGVAPERQMDNAGTKLAYFLYQDAGNTTVWGDTTASYTAPAPATGGADSVTVYGVLTALQTTAIAGAYTDTVTATVSF